jgi:hypothetical protein
MYSVKNNRILLPVEQAAFAYHNNLIKGLAVYLYMKFYTDGKVKKDSPLISQLRKDLKLTDNRTFKKHIDALIKHNWIGHCTFSGVYFIRNTKYIRRLYDFRCRQATIVQPQDVKNLQVYLAAVMICKEVTDQEFYWDVVKKRKLNKAAAKRAVAKHWRASSHSSERPKYFGLCNKSISRLLGCKQTRACVLKNKAAALGYLEIHHRYLDILELDKPDFNVRALLYEQYPDTKGKIRCWRKWKNDKKYIKLVLQLHDEIVSKITFKHIEKLSAIRLPIEIVRGLHNETLKAA